MYTPIGLSEEMRRFAENIDAKRNGPMPALHADFKAGTEATPAQDNTIQTINPQAAAPNTP